MKLFIIEAAVVGAKEALKLGVVWFVFSSFLAHAGRRGILKYFYAALAVTSVTFLFSFFLTPDLALKTLLSKFTGYVFFLFFMASLALLFRPEQASSAWRHWGDRVFGVLAMVLTVAYFAPDIIGSSLFIRELSLMRDAYLPVYLPALTGFVLPLAGLYLIHSSGRLPAARAGEFFGAGQLFLSLALVKLLVGGTGGFAELSLIPAVQRGVMKFVHDVVHQTFVILMVPDHPLLKTTAWNFVAIFFGSNFGMAVALLLLLLPPAAYLYDRLSAPLEAPEEASTGAESRRHRAGLRADRRRKAVPVAAFMLVVVALWFSGRGERASDLYVPAPKPVVEDKGMVIIPLADPTMDLMDGRLHKFSLQRGGETMNLLVIRKPGGRLAVCLDACEICPPEGYGLSGGNVVCIYCRTPIPVDTLGENGGCNPIPLEAEITERDVRISVDEIGEKWRNVITGRTKEGIQ